MPELSLKDNVAILDLFTPVNAKWLTTLSKHRPYKPYTDLKKAMDNLEPLIHWAPITTVGTFRIIGAYLFSADQISVICKNLKACFKVSIETA